MDVVRATAAATTGTSNTTTSSEATSTTADTAASRKSFATLFADAKKDLKAGETLTTVKGHEFGRIKGGERDDMCVNLSGNARSGQAFDLIWRDGRCFHVYGGTGADHVVVEVGTSKADSTSSKTDTAKTATSAASVGGASAA
jgi:hypothetical protein